MKSARLAWRIPTGGRQWSPRQLSLVVVFLVIASLPVFALVPRATTKQIIGPVVDIRTVNVGLGFLARVDTGAMTCSLHVDKWEIVDEAPDMADNLGKTIRFQTSNHRGESEWIERTIVEIAVVRTPDCEEQRYKVPLILRCSGVEKRVLVSLNDRSQMSYAMLLGRNFLDGDFIVDVSQHEFF